MNEKKLKELVKFFSANVPNLGRVKLYKLVFYSDVHHLREHGTSITDSEYIKYEHGPVASKLDRTTKRLKKAEEISIKTKSIGNEKHMHEFKIIRQPDLSIFSDSEKEVMQSVLSRYGKLNGKQLSEISHDEPSWLDAPMMQKMDPELLLYGPCEDLEGL